MGAQDFIYWGGGHQPLFMGVQGTRLYLLGSMAQAFIYWGVGTQTLIYWGGSTDLCLLGCRGHRLLLTGVGAPASIYWGAWQRVQSRGISWGSGTGA